MRSIAGFDSESGRSVEIAADDRATPADEERDDDGRNLSAQVAERHRRAVPLQEREQATEHRPTDDVNRGLDLLWLAGDALGADVDALGGEVDDARRLFELHARSPRRSRRPRSASP